MLGLGILLSTISQTQTQATQVSTLFVLPFVFLSGFIFPIGGMPTVFSSGSTQLVPANYTWRSSGGLCAARRHGTDLWTPIGLLALYTVVILGLAVLRFRNCSVGPVLCSVGRVLSDPPRRFIMLLFELFPAFMLIVCVPIGIWLVAMDRQARRQPATEQSGEWRRPRPRS